MKTKFIYPKIKILFCGSVDYPKHNCRLIVLELKRLKDRYGTDNIQIWHSDATIVDEYVSRCAKKLGFDCRVHLLDHTIKTSLYNKMLDCNKEILKKVECCFVFSNPDCRTSLHTINYAKYVCHVNTYVAYDKSFVTLSKLLDIVYPKHNKKWINVHWSTVYENPYTAYDALPDKYFKFIIRNLGRMCNTVDI